MRPSRRRYALRLRPVSALCNATTVCKQLGRTDNGGTAILRLVNQKLDEIRPNEHIEVDGNLPSISQALILIPIDTLRQ